MVNKRISYLILLIAALLLLIIPFFLFDIGDNVNGTNHFIRFGLHILSFFGAIFLGSLFVTGVTNAAASAVTIKVATVTAAVAITGAVAINALKTTEKDFTALNAKNKKPNTEIINSISTDSSNTITDSLTIAQLPDSTTSIQIDSSSTITSTNSDNETIQQNSSIAKNESAITKPIPNKDKEKKKIDKTGKPNVITENNTVLAEVCNSFQVIHRSKKLDRKLGLSIYDPDKTIKLLNDCGCVIKEAPMTLTRENKVVESKIQNGNFYTLRTFKEVLADDIVSITIAKATCKNEKGETFLYAFPKPIFLSLIIGDHREFDTEKITPTKQPKELNSNNEIKPTQKDKVEEEMNKYGN